MPGVFQLNLSRLFGKKETSLLKVLQCTPCKSHRNNVSTSVCLILMVICRRNNSHQTTYQHLRYATQLHIMQPPNKTISLQTRLVPSYTTCKLRIEIYSKGYNQRPLSITNISLANHLTIYCFPIVILILPTKKPSSQFSHKPNQFSNSALLVVISYSHCLKKTLQENNPCFSYLLRFLLTFIHR